MELSDYLEDPKVRHGLDIIASHESGGHYNVRNGGQMFDDYSDKPRGYAPGGTSSAAGKYQIIDGTWDAYKDKLKLKDFSPHSQDLVAVSLLKDHDALGDAAKGDYASMAKKVGQVWSSLPSYVPHEGDGQQRTASWAEFNRSAGGSGDDTAMPVYTTINGQHHKIIPESPEEHGVLQNLARERLSPELNAHALMT